MVNRNFGRIRCSELYTKEIDDNFKVGGCNTRQLVKIINV